MTKSDKQTRLEEKLNNATAGLSEEFMPFFYEIGNSKALTTKVAYANEIRWFLEFLIGYSPIFCDYEVKDFAVQDLMSMNR